MRAALDVPLHAHRERLEAPEHHVAVERARHAADGLLEEVQAFGEARVARHHRAAHDVRVAVEVLRRRVNRQRGAERERPLEHRRRERVVDRQQDAARAGDGRDGGDVEDLEHRVARRLHPDEARGRAACACVDAARVAHVEVGRLDAELREHLVEDAERAAVHVVADEHVVAALEHEQHRRGRRTSAPERHAVRRPPRAPQGSLSRAARVGLPARE